jgi:flavin reductase (DIM6/NTAB) family NADH-FMN oxidoreductase RutF
VTRTDFDPDDLGPGAFYKLMTAVIVPRPIAWVSSRSADGVDNLAPHSFFTVSSVAPPIIQFTSVGRKDSLNNIEASGEFVVNFTPASLTAEVNATGTNFPPELSEFDAVSLAREPSLKVTPPRVAASPAAFECRLHTIVSFGSSYVVMGRVVHLAVSDHVLRDGQPAIDLLEPTSRLGYNEWGELGEIPDITRIPYEEWPGHFGAGE